jgi:hypothetical protein
VDHKIIRGGAYVNLFEDTQLEFRVDPDGGGVEIVAIGSMELSIGMTPGVLGRCQELLAEAQLAVAAARRQDLPQGA